MTTKQVPDWMSTLGRMAMQVEGELNRLKAKAASSNTDALQAIAELLELIEHAAGNGFDGHPDADDRVIRARAVLDEWMRLGVALLDADDRVILNSEAFVPARGFDEKVFYFGQNVHDHVSTAVDNVIGVEPAQLERSVHYDTLTPQSVAELERLAGRLGMQALKSLNRRAAELAARAGRPASGTPRRSDTVKSVMSASVTSDRDAIPRSSRKPE